jgi:hypothetical protein
MPQKEICFYEILLESHDIFQRKAFSLREACFYEILLESHYRLQRKAVSLCMIFPARSSYREHLKSNETRILME